MSIGKVVKDLSTSLSEPWADTTSLASKMIMTVFAGMADFERDLIRERTGHGREEAIKRGVKFGRPPKISADKKKLAKRLLKEGHSIREVSRLLDVHFTTLYRALSKQDVPPKTTSCQDFATRKKRGSSAPNLVPIEPEKVAISGGCTDCQLILKTVKFSCQIILKVTCIVDTRLSGHRLRCASH